MKYWIRMHIRYILFVSLILLQQSAWGNANHIIPQKATSTLLSTVSPALQKADEGKMKISTKKESLLQSDGIQQSNAQYTKGSCADRCHVDYMTYQTMYHEDYFRHRNHSPKQGMECNLCHENYVDDTKPHGNLIIQNKDCVACHHKKVNNEDCLKCHAEIKEYMDGWIQGMTTKIPDWMSKNVSCTDCHKLVSDGSSFKGVRDYCIECHSSSYGTIHDLWKKMIDSEIKQSFETESNIHTVASQNQPLFSHTSFLAEQIDTVSEYLIDDLPASSSLQGKDIEGVKNFYKEGCLLLDAANRRNLLKFVQSYGMHNVLLSQVLLKFMGNEQQCLK